MKLRCLRILAVMLLMSIVVGEAFAVIHHESREELFFMAVPLIVTATKTSQSAHRAPATVIVITQSQIKERGYNNLLDLLKDLPGVDVQDRGGQETYNAVLMRGINKQDKIIIMMDGHKISSPTGQKIPIAENFPLFHAKQVEIVFGPASALYGADAFAGVINIITQDADEIDGFELSLSGGSFGYFNSHLQYGKKLGEKIKLSAGGHTHVSDNADLRKYYDEYQLDDVSIANKEDRNFYLQTASHSAYLKIEINDSFTLGYNRSFFSHPSGQGVLTNQVLFNKDAQWGTLINGYYADYNFEDGDSLSGTTSLSYLTYEVDPETKFIDLWDDYKVAYKYAKGSRFKLEQQLDFQVTDNNLLTGGAIFEDFYALPKTFNLTHPFDPDRAASEQGYFYDGTDDTLPLKIFELKYQNYGAYLQLQSELNSSLSSVLGLRYDENSRYGSSVNPRGGLVFSPSDKTTIKLLYGEAFQAPSPHNAYAGYGSFSSGPNINGNYEGSGFRLPNPELEPENLKTYELSLIQNPSPAFTFSASTFYTDVDNLIQDVKYSETSTYIEGGEVINWKRKENRAEAYFYGGELSVDYKTNIKGIILKSWGNYSYVNGKQRLENSPKTRYKSITEHKVKMGLTARIDQFYVSPSVKWIGRSNNRLASSTTSYSRDERTVDDYFLVNLHLGLENKDKTRTIVLNIQNLLDKRYYNSGESSQRFLSIQQEPRRFILGLTFKN